MSLLGADLAEDTLQEVAVLGTAAATAALVAAGEATVTSTAPSTGVVVGVVVAAASHGRHVCGGLKVPIVEFLALLEGGELGLQLRNGDGFNSCRHSRYHRIEFKIQPGQYVGDKLLVFQLVPDRGHFIC